MAVYDVFFDDTPGGDLADRLDGGCGPGSAWSSWLFTQPGLLPYGYNGDMKLTNKNGNLKGY